MVLIYHGLIYDFQLYNDAKATRSAETTLPTLIFFWASDLGFSLNAEQLPHHKDK